MNLFCDYFPAGLCVLDFFLCASFGQDSMELSCQTFPTCWKQKSMPLPCSLNTYPCGRNGCNSWWKPSPELQDIPLLPTPAMNAPFDSILWGSSFSWQLTPVILKVRSPEEQHQLHLGLVRNANSHYRSIESEILAVEYFQVLWNRIYCCPAVFFERNS